MIDANVRHFNITRPCFLKEHLKFILLLSFILVVVRIFISNVGNNKALITYEVLSRYLYNRVHNEKRVFFFFFFLKFIASFDGLW